MKFRANNFPHVRQLGHGPESSLLFPDRKETQMQEGYIGFSFSLIFIA
jgi:hypothetical protein